MSSWEKRIDPVDGVAYTWDEMFSEYIKKFTRKKITKYWEEVCLPEKRKVPKGKSGAAATGKANLPKEQVQKGPAKALVQIMARREKDWRIGPIVYQVFVDRFAPPADFEQKKALYPEVGTTHKWDELPQGGHLVAEVGYYSNELAFWGGDFASMLSKMDHLKELGVDVLYLQPITECTSNHKYDTKDYMKVDAQYGTLDDFKKVVDTLHGASIKLVLDVVFNHCGKSSPLVQEALADKDSPKRNWFFFGDQYKQGFKTWGLRVPLTDAAEGLSETAEDLPTAEPNFTISGQISFPYEGISEMQAKAGVRASLENYIPVTPGAIVRLTASPKVVQRRLAGVRGRRLFATWSVGYEISVPQTQGPVVQSRVENLDGLISVGRASAFSNGLRYELVSEGAEPASAFFVSSCLTSACWQETQQTLKQAVPTSSSSSAAEQPCSVGAICKAEGGYMILGGGVAFVAFVGVCIGCFCCRRVKRHRVGKDTPLTVTHVDAGPARELRRLEAARWAFAEEVLGSAADFPRTTIPEVWTGSNVWGEATESAFQQAAKASPTRDYKLDFQTGVFEGQGRDTTGNFQVVGGACDPSTGRILWREESQDGGVAMECEGQMSVKRLKGSRRGEEGWEIIGICSAFDTSCTVALMGTGVLALHTSARATLNAPPQFSADDEDADDEDADEFMVMDTTSSPASRREGKLIGKPSGRTRFRADFPEGFCNHLNKGFCVSEGCQDVERPSETDETLSKCWEHVEKARPKGIEEHPEWYRYNGTDLSSDSPMTTFQKFIYDYHPELGCPPPCLPRY
ncbi:unnamed protein product [Polarella glacialis]|uniref:Glycosyl hydrolase family 13 catalytic domain-containing protein n=1 Tax=Polarella glacialis TaxID=89957 RepID=A0A813HK44_POLGL|nr:unnamed protein product [Polarella glacialis]